MSATETIRAFEPFGNLSDEQIDEIAQACDLVAFDEGQIIYEAGTPTDSAYILVSGEVSYDDPDVSVLDLDAGIVRKPGTLLSKGSLLQPFDHRHTLVAVTDTELLSLRRDTFQEKIATGSSAAMELLDWLISRIADEVRDLNRVIHELMP